MAPRNRIQQLREIERIRTVQHLAAELDALQAVRNLERLSQERINEARHLEGFEEGWRHAVEGGSIGNPMMLAWSAAICRQTEILAEIELQLESSRSVNVRVQRDWREASSRHKLAGEAADNATRRLSRRREENRAAELVDQHLIRRELP